jgi:hypothetical protein
VTGTFLGAVVCPHPPLLLRELTGREDPAAELRAACRAAVRELVGRCPDRVVVAGLAEPEHAPWSRRIARRLLDESGWHGKETWVPLGEDSDCDRAGAAVHRGPGRTALLVMADGSAARTVKAPGHFDERARDFDHGIVRALREGDHVALRALDGTLARELRMQGVPALRVLAAAMGSAGRDIAPPHVSYVDDPFGVLYFVVTWPASLTDSS